MFHKGKIIFKKNSLFRHNEWKIYLVYIFSYSLWNMLKMYQTHFDAFCSFEEENIFLWSTYISLVAVWICSEKIYTHIWHFIFTMYSYCNVQYSYTLIFFSKYVSLDILSITFPAWRFRDCRSNLFEKDLLECSSEIIF